ncbi:MAG: hypothetical protein HYY04_10295, partial [Chloroflexi bacterium]|nr:hypothetical protein [Chloroflexota bacterium]
MPRRSYGQRLPFQLPPGLGLVWCWLALELGFLLFFAVGGLPALRLAPTGLADRWPGHNQPTRLLVSLIGLDRLDPATIPRVALGLFAWTLVVLVLGALFATSLARRVPHPTGRHAALVLIGTGLFGATLVGVPTLLSEDLFLYASYGRIIAVHGANPLVQPPSAFPADPLLSRVFWRDQPALYGPLWLLIAAGVATLAERLGGEPAVYVLLFRAVGLGFHLGAGVVLWRLLDDVAPAVRLAGLVTYAWNPLVLVEVVGNGHTEGLIALLLLLALRAVARGHPVPALATIGLAIATKLVMALLVPVFLWHCLLSSRFRAFRSFRPPCSQRRGPNPHRAQKSGKVEYSRIALTAVLAVALPVIVGYALFAPGMSLASFFGVVGRAIGATANTTNFYNSLHEVAIHLLGGVSPRVAPDPGASPALEALLKAIGGLVMVLVIVALCRRAWRRSFQLPPLPQHGACSPRLTGGEMARGAAGDAGWLLLAYLVGGCIWFWPWYLVPLIALATLQTGTFPGSTSDSRLLRSSWLLTAGGLLLYVFLPQYPPAPLAAIFGYRALIVFGPLLVLLVAAVMPVPTGHVRSWPTAIYSALICNCRSAIRSRWLAHRTAVLLALLLIGAYVYFRV